MATRKIQRLGANSVSKQSETFISANALIEPPDGVFLRTEDERMIWSQFIKARARDDWRDMDLILLGKVVRAEADIRRYNDMLDKSSPIIQNRRGTLVENPLLRVIDTTLRQQLAVIRSMSLNSTPSDPRTLHANAASEQQARDAIKNAGVMSLLAKPLEKQ